MLKSKDIIADISLDYDHNIQYSKSLTPYHIAHSSIYGDHAHSWSLLTGYLFMLRGNSSTYINFKIHTDGTHKFSFFSLHASIMEFKDDCGPVFIIEGTYLKGKYKCVLRVAVTKDGDEQIFSLACGIADNKEIGTWIWFLQQMQNAFDYPEKLLISVNRARSIKRVIMTTHPEAFREMNTYEICKNLIEHGS